MHRRTIVDGSVRRPGVFESRPAASALPESGGSANPPASYFQDDRVGYGWAVKNSDVRQYQGCIRQERTAAAGSWFDVLHDVEATVFWPQIRERGFSSDVLVPQDGRYVLGRWPSWLAGVRASILSAADHRVHYFGVEVVGRNACAHGLARRGLIARKPDTASSVVTRGATRAPQKARRRQQPKNRRLRVVKLRKALFVGALRCAQDKLKLRPPENSRPQPVRHTLTALGGALDLDCCAVDQDFGDTLHQLV